jgi:aspartate aminotransferase-like enzyme
MDNGLRFKFASEQGEYEQIHELNYETFVEEIPQHHPNSEKELVDKFHSENSYIICLEGDDLVGMLAVRDTRPFSLDKKIPDLDSYLPPARAVCEIRLLSVRKERRRRKVLLGLFTMLASHCEQMGYDLALISGNVSQEKLYTNLGFKPFGPRVGTEEAMYQPMYLTPEGYYRMKEKTKLLSRMNESVSGSHNPVNLLPGPVDVRPEAHAAMNEAPVSHRSEEFIRSLNQVKHLLSNLTGAGAASILMGSGTLANDAVAAQLSLLPEKGILLSNGEFGDRLIDHASRWGLDFRALRIEWGKAFHYDEIRELLSEESGAGWLWAVHSETSTGVLNDVGALGKICRDMNIRLCLDCVSSIGTVPLDLSQIYLASGVSGKGLRSYPGISFVLHNHFIESAGDKLPRYLDLGLYSGNSGTPFTLSSNLLNALKASLENTDFEERYTRLKELSEWIKKSLTDSGLIIVAEEGYETPSLITIALPANRDSREIGLELEKRGFLLNWRSAYLRERNWIQIALMGDSPRNRVAPLPYLLGDLLNRRVRAL